MKPEGSLLSHKSWPRNPILSHFDAVHWFPERRPSLRFSSKVIFNLQLHECYAFGPKPFYLAQVSNRHRINFRGNDVCYTWPNFRVIIRKAEQLRITPLHILWPVTGRSDLGECKLVDQFGRLHSFKHGRKYTTIFLLIQQIAHKHFKNGRLQVWRVTSTDKTGQALQSQLRYKYS
jgi:hypothetical protein